MTVAAEDIRVVRGPEIPYDPTFHFIYDGMTVAVLIYDDHQPAGLPVEWQYLYADEPSTRYDLSEINRDDGLPASEELAINQMKRLTAGYINIRGLENVRGLEDVPYDEFPWYVIEVPDDED